MLLALFAVSDLVARLQLIAPTATRAAPEACYYDEEGLAAK